MKKLIGVLAFIVFIAGCGGGGAEKYYSLAEGNKWEYETILYSKTMLGDSLISKSYDTTTSSTEVVGKTTMEDGTEVWELKTQTDTITASSYVYEGEDTLKWFATKQDTVPNYWEPVDLSVGTKWTVTRSFNLDDTTVITYDIIYEVESEEDVSVPAGDFSCLKVKGTASYEYEYMGNTTTGTIEEYQWKAKGVGVVKTKYTQTITTQTAVGEMTVTTETESNLTSKNF